MSCNGDSCIKSLSECLSIYRGDAVSFDLDLDLDGASLNLNDYLAFFTVKKRDSDPDSKAVILKDSDNPAGPSLGGINILNAIEGKARVVLLHNDTKDLLEGSYYYGVSVVKKDDDALVYTLLKGRFVVNLDIRVGIASPTTTTTTSTTTTSAPASTSTTTTTTTTSTTTASSTRTFTFNGGTTSTQEIQLPVVPASIGYTTFSIVDNTSFPTSKLHPSLWASDSANKRPDSFTQSALNETLVTCKKSTANPNTHVNISVFSGSSISSLLNNSSIKITVQYS